MYLITTDTTVSVQAKTNVAPVTPLSCVVTYHDFAMYGANVGFGPTVDNFGINDVYADIVPATVEHQRREVRYLSIYNSNTATHDILIRLYNTVGPVASFVHRVRLREKWRAEYNADKGWTIYDEYGAIVQFVKTNFVAQSAPGAVLTDIYTAVYNTKIEKIYVANRSNAIKTFRLSFAPLGAADATTQYLYYDVSIAKNETKEIFGPIMLSPTDKIRVYGQDNNVTFTVNGITES